MSSAAQNQITLSRKQSQAWEYLEDSETTEVFFGGGAGCFLSGTLIKTLSGHIPIELIKEGMMVKSFNTSTNEFEYKKVLKTFKHDKRNTGVKICEFNFGNIKLKCTDNHEFYFRGNWNRASDIAGRNVEIHDWLIEPIFSFESRQTINNRLQELKSGINNEARIGRNRLFKNNVIIERQTQNDKSSSYCSAELVAERTRESYRKPQRHEQTKQSYHEFGMGNGAGKCKTRLSERSHQETGMHQLRQRFKNRDKQTNGISGCGNTSEVQAEKIYTPNVSGRIRGFTRHYKGCYIAELEARSVKKETYSGYVYDLCVEDNHNYCVTELDIIAHNSGKSYFSCIWHIYRRAKYPQTRGLIGRAKISNLEQSTLITLFKVASEMGYRAGVDFDYNSQKHIISWNNGSQTILKDLFFYPSDPDFISLGSTEYTDAVIDEAPEITLRAFELVNSRIRWKLADYGLMPKTLLTGNPSPGWVRDRYIKDKDGHRIELRPYQRFVQALVHDNPDDAFKGIYISQLEKLTDDYDRMRLLEGDWDVERSATNPFAHQFDKRHISEQAVFNPSRQIVISIDFNLNPFAVTFHHAWQDSSGFHHHQFDEGEIANGSIPAMVDFIKTRKGGEYYRKIHGAILTGDAMGNKRDISQRDNASLYKQLLRGLGMSEAQLKVHNNPTHENSRADCNYFLAYFPDYKIHPANCVNTIRDLRNVQCDAFGQIIKKDRKDINQRADYIDAGLRYTVHNIHKGWIDRHQKTQR